MIDNLKSLHEEHKNKLTDLELNISRYFQDRLLAVLKKADIQKFLRLMKLSLKRTETENLLLK